MNARRLLVLALFVSLPALGAKPKVLVDAPAPIKAMIVKAVAKKYKAINAPKSLSDDPSANEVTEATRKAGTKALIIGRVQGSLYSVQVLDGYDGSPTASFRFKAPPGKRKLKALPKGSDKRLEEGLRGARGPAPKKAAEPPPEVVAEKEKPPRDESSPPPPPPSRGEEERRAERSEPSRDVRDPDKDVEKRIDEPELPSTHAEFVPKLRLGVTARAFSRRFFYRDDLFGALSRYELGAGPSAGAEIEFYPAAFLSKGIASQIGIAASFDTAFGIASVAKDPTTQVETRYNTSALRLKVSVIGRLKAGPLEFNPLLGYAMQTYSIASSVTAPINVPAVSYGALRVGGNLRFGFLERFAIHLGAAFQQPISYGEIKSDKYFPNLTANGMDAWLAVSFAVLKNVEIKAGIDYTRFGYKMNPKPLDPYIAGGALDDYKGMSVALSYML